MEGQKYQPDLPFRWWITFSRGRRIGRSGLFRGMDAGRRGYFDGSDEGLAEGASRGKGSGEQWQFYTVAGCGGESVPVRQLLPGWGELFRTSVEGSGRQCAGYYTTEVAGAYGYGWLSVLWYAAVCDTDRGRIVSGTVLFFPGCCIGTGRKPGEQPGERQPDRQWQSVG